MRIVIDLQGAQSATNRFRGIGRFVLSLAQAMARNAANHEIWIALSSLFPDAIEPIRATFDGLIPHDNIRVWYAHGPVDFVGEENKWLRRTAELVRETFLASLAPDVVLVGSLFEGRTEDAVTSIGTLGRSLPTAVIQYDLIPLLHRRVYLQNPRVEAWYENKLGHLRRSDLLLAISESSRQEAIRHLGFSAGAVINISAGVDPRFRPQTTEPQSEAELRNRYGLHRSFVMYTGGIDNRKNVEGLIRGYAKLPNRLRSLYQLLVVCAVQRSDQERLEILAKSHGLEADELVFTGFVSDEQLVALYNLCKLFVLPSWHEGFGLPALEAMSCGRAVIGANTTGVPEVIGRDDALFDPHSDTAIAKKLTQVLDSETLCKDLERHGLEQARKFSWDKSAQRAIAALESWHEEHNRQGPVQPLPTRRPRLAYVSPLPPERSGISNYSAELLPELSRHYEIDVVVAQDAISDPWILANCPIKRVDDFTGSAGTYDRVLYHFGNSEFHKHMFALLEAIPGVVVLHDFFLSGILARLDATGFAPDIWARELYRAHGYAAAAERFHAADRSGMILKYPTNLSVLADARGVIVHSEHSRDLARQWYGVREARDWVVVPHLRAPPSDIDRRAARHALGFTESEFVVCSFGVLGWAKFNHRLVDAWLASRLAGRADCKLVFVGENQGDDYGEALSARIEDGDVKDSIRITGWVDIPVFRQYLAAADASVQLRTHTRGETSGTVLDCMNYGLATIVNAHGSLANLPDAGVLKLPDAFADEQLIKALEILWRDTPRRRQLGARAREVIKTHHLPRYCADRYAQAIEVFYAAGAVDRNSLIRTIASIEGSGENTAELPAVATAIARTFPLKQPARQLLLDVSLTRLNDEKTGIQRVTRALLREFINAAPPGYRVEPVYLSDARGRWHYRYARNYTMDLLGCPSGIMTDEMVEPQTGDIFLGLDLVPKVAQASSCLDEMHRHGVRIYFMVYDLLPLLMPQMFGLGAAVSHEKWVRAIARYDGAVCTSRAVADELNIWLADNRPEHRGPFLIGWSHLGADLSSSFPSAGLPDNSEQVLLQLAQRPSFLLVGTIEPRKGYEQTLAAFERLWAEGNDVSLTIVGEEGWNGCSGMETVISDFVARLRSHPEYGKRLLWLKCVSDEYLERIYATSTALITASEGEGFGLSLIEAAQNKLPIIARDIPALREVAGEHAYYFRGKELGALAQTIKDWLALYASNQHPKSDTMPRLTWKESAERLKRIIVNGDWQALAAKERAISPPL
jgi:glycosyltransferase involved in cell wall biosynthesis